MEAILLIVFFLIALAVGAERKARAARIEEAYKFNPEKAHGGAKFVDNEGLKRSGWFKSRALHIGFSPHGWHKLFFNTAGHILVVAGARTGKLVTVLGGLILSLPKRYGLLVFDPKAEIACVFGDFLKSRGRVYVLNPFGIFLDRMKGLTQASFNAMSSLDPNSRSFHADCDKLADATCWEEGHSSDSHWIISARLLISGIIAALARHGKAEEKNLVVVRNVITGANGQSVYDFCREAMKSSDPYIRQKLARFAVEARPGIPGAEVSRELNSVVSTADSQSGFISGAIAESLRGGTNAVDFRDLKRKPGTSIIVCLPLDQMPVSHKWFRVLASTGISETLVEGLRGNGAPVLAVLDEISVIGPLKVLSDAWGMSAGAAQLQLMAIYQSVGQMVSQFGENFQTIVANSGAAVYFGVRDQQTAEFVSKQCGTTEVLSRSRSVNIDIRTGEPSVSDSAAQTARPLLHPDEVRFGLRDDEMLLFADGLQGVCRARRKPYFSCGEFRGKYRDNPYFQKHGGGLVRWLFE